MNNYLFSYCEYEIAVNLLLIHIILLILGSGSIRRQATVCSRELNLIFVIFFEALIAIAGSRMGFM